jgi:hypothetical protein
MNRKVFLAGVLFLALGVIGLLGQQASTQGSDGATLAGSWYFETVLPNNMGLCPSVVIFHSDGTVSASGCVALGGLVTNHYLYTPFQGVWERIGPHEFKATLYSLRFDPALGASAGVPSLVVAVARKIDYFSFAGDFDHFAGTSYMQVLSCPSPPTCPDPQTAPESAWTSFNPPTPSNPNVTILGIYAARITSDRH